MSKSKIILYQTDLAPNLNYAIESIDKYLDNCWSSDEMEVRYIEPKLRQTIVLKGTQSYLATGLMYNYAKVITQDETYTTIQYYFVQSLDWGSHKSVKVNLYLDTLNTLKYYITNNLDDKTTIIREHRDRWKLVNGQLIAIVDKYAEDLNVAKTEQTTRVELNNSNLFYVQISANATTTNNTDTHPYKNLICYENTTQIDPAGTSAGTYTVPVDNHVYTFLEGTITYKTSSTASTNSYTIGASTKSVDGIVSTLRMIKVSPSEVKLVYCTGDSFPYAYHTETTELYYLSAKVSNVRRMYRETYSASVFSLVALDRVPFLSYTDINVGYYSAHNVVGIDDLDKTQSYIMQINPIPQFALTSNFEFIEGYNMLLLSTYRWRIAKSNTLDTNTHTYNGATLTDNYDYTLESKLLHPTITESSVNYQGNILFNIDWARLTEGSTTSITDYITLSDSNVSLLKFNTNLTNYNTYSQFDGVSFVANKYNVPLFTNAWTEYVRNGYNYDVAELSRQKTLQGWNIALGAVNAGVGMSGTVGRGIGMISNAVKSYTRTKNEKINEQFENMFVDPLSAYEYAGYSSAKNGYNMYYGEWDHDADTFNKYSEYIPATSVDPYAKRAAKNAAKQYLKNNSAGELGTMVLSQGINSLGSAVSAGYSISSANANYENMIISKSQAKTTINGNTTDYKLAIDNILTYEVWQPEQYVLEDIAKTFFYTGYSHPVIAKPNINTRLWFNYIQCIPHWTLKAINETNPEWLADYTNKLQSGVTVFHYIESAGWDLAQTHENWEMSIYGK